MNFAKQTASASGRIYSLLALGLAACAAATLAGCHAEHEQSMLHPEGAASAEIALLWWILFGICAAVFLIVMLLLIAALWAPRPRDASRAPLGNRFILISGAIIPAVVLIVILIASVRTQLALAVPETELTIEVIGHQFWWEVRYPDQQIVTANEIIIPAGEPVRLELRSADVIHSLWVPNLNGKTDLLPDKVNVAWLSADGPGRFRGQCAEYCGVQHAWMALTVVALERSEFDSWVAGRQRPVAAPQTERARRGHEVYYRASCHNCHSISGSYAARLRGPDLSHIASRPTLAAGRLPNDRENMRAWIADPQRFKPGNFMPHTELEHDDLEALVEFLEALK